MRVIHSWRSGFRAKASRMNLVMEGARVVQYFWKKNRWKPFGPGLLKGFISKTACLISNSVGTLLMEDLSLGDSTGPGKKKGSGCKEECDFKEVKMFVKQEKIWF